MPSIHRRYTPPAHATTPKTKAQKLNQQKNGKQEKLIVF
jgi:hypothetical protein